MKTKIILSLLLSAAVMLSTACASADTSSQESKTEASSTEQTSSESVASEAEQSEENGGESYTALSEAEIPDLKEQGEQTAEKTGARNVILDEESLGEYSVQFVGDYVYTDEQSSPESYFAGEMKLRIVKDGEEVGAEAFRLDERNAQQERYEIAKSNLSAYVRAYTMKDGNKEFPVFATLYGDEANGFDTTFYTIGESGELTCFDSSITEYISASGSTVAMNTSGDLTANSEKHSLTDNANEFSLIFYYENTKVVGAMSVDKVLELEQAENNSIIKDTETKLDIDDLSDYVGLDGVDLTYYILLKEGISSYAVYEKSDEEGKFTVTLTVGDYTTKPVEKWLMEFDCNFEIVSCEGFDFGKKTDGSMYCYSETPIPSSGELKIELICSSDEDELWMDNFNLYSEPIIYNENYDVLTNGEDDYPIHIELSAEPYSETVELTFSVKDPAESYTLYLYDSYIKDVCVSEGVINADSTVTQSVEAEKTYYYDYIGADSKVTGRFTVVNWHHLHQIDNSYDITKNN